MEHYLDNAATTKVCPEAADAALKAMTEVYGNPSSTHTKGREARKLLDASRAQIAKALGCRADELFFTSCGSESDNWALLSGAYAMRHSGRHIISSRTEHDAVRKTLKVLEESGYEVTYLDTDKTGAVDPESFADAVRRDTILVSLMMVNNETGALTDIKKISEIIKSSGSKALLHTDAVQAFMKVPFSAAKLGADMISISGHKIHAPKGVGALYVKKGLKLRPLISGGQQESGMRAGTEAMPQIAAFAAACSAAFESMDENILRMSSLKELCIKLLSESIPEIFFIRSETPHILNISLPGWRSEVLMNWLEAREIYVSKSSACKKGGRSHVLEAIGLDSRTIDGALRIGLSRFTTEDDIYALSYSIIEAREKLSHR